MKKKGFTLVELLAVIVVLAVVAIITVPVVLNVIDKVKKESYKDSVYGIMESGKIYLASHMDSISEKEEITFTCDGSKCSGNKGELTFKGSVPKSGSIYVRGTGEVLVESLYNGKYYANGSSEEGINVLTEDSTMTRSELTDAIKILIDRVDYLENENQLLKDKDNSLQGQISSIGGSATSINEVYPVGSIYITLNDVNPSTLFPGTTWERYGQGKTLIGHDGTNYITGATGGSSTVTLTTSNIPTLSVTGSTTASSTTSGNNSVTPTASFTGNRVSTENTGSGYSWSHACEWRGTTEAGNHNHTGYMYNGVDDMNFSGNDRRPAGSDYLKEDLFSTNYAGNHTHSSLDCYLNGISGVATHAHYYTASGSVSLSNTTHNHSISIPSLTVNASYTNNNQTSINVQDPYIVVYMWRRVS